jgi:hypothetical protein
MVFLEVRSNRNDDREREKRRRDIYESRQNRGNSKEKARKVRSKKSITAG